MTTADLLESIRADIKRDLRDEILAELKPVIQRQLYSNVFKLGEAAKYLKVSQSTLRRMIADNSIPYFMQRGNYYFRQSDLDRHIAALVMCNKRSLAMVERTKKT